MTPSRSALWRPISIWLAFTVAACASTPPPNKDASSGVVDAELDSGSVSDLGSVSDSVSVSDSGSDSVSVSDSGSGADSATDAGFDGPWHSKLYTKTGARPTLTGGWRLQDYSYAGYKFGEVPIGAAVTATVDVTTLGADPAGDKDSTKAIQAAIDKLAKTGGIVWLPKGTYRCDGTLVVTASKTVIRGAGAKLTRIYFTKHAGMDNMAHITFSGKLAFGACFSAHQADPGGPWVKNHFNGAHSTQAGQGLKPGDDVAMRQKITDAFVADYKMTGTWKAFNNTLQPFEWLTVVKTSPNWHGSANVKTKPPIRYPYKLRDKPELCKVTGYLHDVGIEDLSIANAVNWDDAWKHNQVHAIAMLAVKDAWVQRVHSFDAPEPKDEGLMKGAHLQSSGVMVKLSKRVTIQDCHMANAQNRGGGGNGYLFEIRQSGQVLTTQCTAKHGRHNFIQNWGFGTSGCVWHKVHSSDGLAMLSSKSPIGSLGYSEFHHSLAMYNLVDNSTFDDGWASKNRGNFSTGAGHTATENVLWNIGGKGQLQSFNFGRGFVVGTGKDVKVWHKLPSAGQDSTAPEDHVEGLGHAAKLQPQSLYEAQLAKRLGK